MPLLAGVTLFVVGLVIAGLAPSMLVLVAGRVVQGVGTGLYSVVLYVIVARVYPERLRPRVFAAFAAAWVVPGIVGPYLAGLVVEHAGWRWVFLGVPALAVPAVLALWPALVGLRGQAVVGRPRSSFFLLRSTPIAAAWMYSLAVVRELFPFDPIVSVLPKVCDTPPSRRRSRSRCSPP